MAGNKRLHAVAFSAAAYLILDDDEKEAKKRQRSTWVSPWLLRRDNDGAYAKLLPELAAGDRNEQKLFASFNRMSKANFDYLLDLVVPIIEKQDTFFRSPIRPGARLALTLHFLATGNSYRSLQFVFIISPSSISVIIPEVLDAIYTVLAPRYLKVPSTAAEWNDIAAKFEIDWNYPNCLGAIDGKHVVMVAPPNSGSIFYNYKRTHSIVLMAICDAEYKFLYIDVGCNGRMADGGVFNNCSFTRAMRDNQLDLPPPRALPGREMEVPHVFVADDAFALQPNIMKPFAGRNLMPSKRVYNYRLSRARRCIENAFGIMSARFRVLRSPINLDAAKTRKVTKACCALHNFLLSQNNTSYAPTSFVDHRNPEGAIVEGGWRQSASVNNLIPLKNRNTNAQNDAKKIREEFEIYFMTSGAVPWQFKYALVEEE